MAKGYGRPPMGRKGGKMGMGMPGLNMDMIKQAQKMQADMEKTQLFIGYYVTSICMVPYRKKRIDVRYSIMQELPKA